MIGLSLSLYSRNTYWALSLSLSLSSLSSSLTLRTRAMCPGSYKPDFSRITQVSEPRRIWGPRLLSAQQRCSAELVGLAFVAAIVQVELDTATSSQTPNQQVPRVLKPANQQNSRHCTRPKEKSSAHHRKSKGPSIFTVSTPSCLNNTSSPHFSTSCYLCKRPLPSNKDIYMYRGDQAFCTKQCRYHQMAIDENEERLRLRTAAFTPTKCHMDYYKYKERSFACA